MQYFKNYGHNGKVLTYGMRGERAISPPTSPQHTHPASRPPPGASSNGAARNRESTRQSPGRVISPPHTTAPEGTKGVPSILWEAFCVEKRIPVGWELDPQIPLAPSPSCRPSLALPPSLAPPYLRRSRDILCTRNVQRTPPAARRPTTHDPRPTNDAKRYIFTLREDEKTRSRPKTNDPP